jgi:hypothetical protein
MQTALFGETLLYFGLSASAGAPVAANEAFVAGNGPPVAIDA